MSIVTVRGVCRTFGSFVFVDTISHDTHMISCELLFFFACLLPSLHARFTTKLHIFAGRHDQVKLWKGQARLIRQPRLFLPAGMMGMLP